MHTCSPDLHLQFSKKLWSLQEAIEGNKLCSNQDASGYDEQEDSRATRFAFRKRLIQKSKWMSTGRAAPVRRELHSAIRLFGRSLGKEVGMQNILRSFWLEDEAQDIAEYAVMLAVILVIVVGTIRLIGGNANNVFSSVASSIAQ